MKLNWKGWLALFGIVLVSFAIGTAAAGSDTTKTAKPKTITRTVTSIVTNTNTVTETPQACKDALDTARQVFTLTGNMMGTFGDVFGIIPNVVDAVQNYDTAAIEAATAQVSAANDKLSTANDELTTLTPTFQSAAAECEGS